MIMRVRVPVGYVIDRGPSKVRYRVVMVFRIGSARRSRPAGSETPTQGEAAQDAYESPASPVLRIPGVAEDLFGDTDPDDIQSAVLAEIDRLFVQAFALVGEAIAGATHALLAGDREAAKHLVERDELVDALTTEIAQLTQTRIVSGKGSLEERRELVAVMRMLPDLERNGDLAEHIARRAARGMGNEMSARSRGLVERMGEVATTIWRSTADVFAERSAIGANVVDALDDEMDDLHVTLTAEVVTGNMPLPVAIELAMVARFYERFGDHAVSLARRMAALVSGGPDPGQSGGD